MKRYFKTFEWRGTETQCACGAPVFKGVEVTAQKNILPWPEILNCDTCLGAARISLAEVKEIPIAYVGPSQSEGT